MSKMLHQFRKKTFFLLLVCPFIFVNCSQTKEGKKDSKKVPKVTGKYTPESNLVKSCRNGDGKNCLDIGQNYLKVTDHRKAYKFFEIGCNVDFGDACFEAALLKFEYSEIVEGKQYLIKSCRLKNAEACLEAAGVIERGGTLKEDQTMIESIPVDSTEQGSEKILENENRDDWLEYFGLLVQACDYGEPDGCSKLGHYYYKRNQLTKGFSFFKRACNQNNYQGCYNTGQMLVKLGKPHLASEYFMKSCNQGVNESCYNLSCYFARTGKINEGLEYFQKALEFGFKDWHLIEHDLDLSNIRNMSQFRSLIDRYKSN